MGADKEHLTYGSMAYKFLCYGKMKGTSFHLKEAKNCLAGEFAKADISAIKRIAKRLSEKSFYEYNSKDDTWKITDQGIREMYASAGSYRLRLRRDVGARFLAQIKEEMARCSMIGPYMSEEQMDAEDAILEKLNAQIKVRNEHKKPKSRRVPS